MLLANVTSISSSGGDLKTLSEDVSVEVPSDSSDVLLDARKPLSARKICSTLQFSIQDLKLRRLQKLSQLQFSNSICQRTKAER